MKVLSLFDGMACGMIAAKNAGLNIESYDAYEIDKYAIQSAIHNFPEIKEHGDVFKADFTQYKDIDFMWGEALVLIGALHKTLIEKQKQVALAGICFASMSEP